MIGQSHGSNLAVLLTATYPELVTKLTGSVADRLISASSMVRRPGSS
jgi:hypothetical protein